MVNFDRQGWIFFGVYLLTSMVQSRVVFSPLVNSTKRAIGCLYGQVIGDSLGTRYEFKSAYRVQEMIKKDLSKNPTHAYLPILGGGPFGLEAGQVTDDSEMALSLASSLARCRTFDAADVACSYVFWAQSSPKDIGFTTRKAFSIDSSAIAQLFGPLKGEVGEQPAHNFGTLRITQLGNTLVFEGILRGIPAGYHGFTLHQNGDIREECEAVGPHFNPHGNRHGGVDDEMRHAGDLGNIFSDGRIAKVMIHATGLSLHGPNSIVGRSLVVHERPDDFGKKDDAGSFTTGNSGNGIACGVIGLIDRAQWHLPPDWYSKFSAKEKEAIHQEVLNNVKKNSIGSLSNGCLMRISPLAVFSINSLPQEVQEMVEADCSLTHSDTNCSEAVFAYVMAIRDLIHGKNATTAFETALRATSSPLIRKHLLAAKERPIPTNSAGLPMDADAKDMGYIGVALQSAFHELLNGKSFVESLVGAISRGGDTDTNGAIVGALLGARFGVDNIPNGWINTVNNAMPRRELYMIEHNVERVAKKLLMPNS